MIECRNRGAAVGALRFDVRQPDMVRPAVRADLDVVAAIVVSAIDQHIESAGCAHFAEGDFCGVVAMAVCIILAKRPRPL